MKYTSTTSISSTVLSHIVLFLIIVLWIMEVVEVVEGGSEYYEYSENDGVLW